MEKQVFMNKKNNLNIDLDGVLLKKSPFLEARSLGRILSKSPSNNKIRQFKQESQAKMEKLAFMNKKNKLSIDLD